ncbi:MAG: cytochrome c biogenesis protein CcdA [Bryobacteraceae bacterium]
MFTVLGLTLLIPRLADLISRPFVRLGNTLTRSAPRLSGTGSSVLLGIATGLLWAPGAGPILGLILTEAAIQGVTLRTSLLLLSYALGAATSLAVAMLAGGLVFQYLKRESNVRVADNWPTHHQFRLRYAIVESNIQNHAPMATALA